MRLAPGTESATPTDAVTAVPLVRAAGRTDQGPNRENNEDAVLVRSEAAAGFHLFAVADGLGGHRAGEVASRMVMETLAEGRPSADRPERWLRQAFNAANLAIWNHSQSHPEAFNLQSTATALILTGPDAVIGHVGDCRVYLLRDGVITQCTSDHTQAMEMLRMRIITAEQAVRHPARNQLTRSLGAELFLNVDVSRRRVLQGDVFVLCSDGLWSEVTRDEIAIAAEAEADPDAVASSLIRIAVDRGAADNVSVVVVRVAGPVEAPPVTHGRRWLPWR
ncbi:MAG: protein phosphatase 2C domain-containing protein [Candidatus Dormibacteria bacterium]|jgi:protein phosphatase